MELQLCILFYVVTKRALFLYHVTKAEDRYIYRK